jgi:hypothetical protein
MEAAKHKKLNNFTRLDPQHRKQPRAEGVALKYRHPLESGRTTTRLRSVSWLIGAPSLRRRPKFLKLFSFRLFWRLSFVITILPRDCSSETYPKQTAGSKVLRTLCRNSARPQRAYYARRPQLEDRLPVRFLTYLKEFSFSQFLARLSDASVRLRTIVSNSRPSALQARPS